MSNVPPPPPGGGFPPPAGGPPPGPPPGVPGPLAEWQDRLISGLIDIIGPYFLAGILSTMLAVAVGLSGTGPTSFGFNWPGLLVGLLAGAWVLYNGYLAGETGQSFGMKQSGLRMVGEQTGQPVGGSQGLVRNALYVAVVLLNAFCCIGWILLVVDSLFPLWDPKKQTLRDKIGKTVVIKAA